MARERGAGGAARELQALAVNAVPSQEGRAQKRAKKRARAGAEAEGVAGEEVEVVKVRRGESDYHVARRLATELCGGNERLARHFADEMARYCGAMEENALLRAATRQEQVAVNKLRAKLLERKRRKLDAAREAQACLARIRRLEREREQTAGIGRALEQLQKIPRSGQASAAAQAAGNAPALLATVADACASNLAGVRALNAALERALGMAD